MTRHFTIGMIFQLQNHEHLHYESGAFPPDDSAPSDGDRDGDFLPFYNKESGYTVWLSTKDHRLSFYTFDVKKKNAT